MKKKQILRAIVFGSMLVITGCGDDETGNGGGGGSPGSGGIAGSGGSTGTGGSGGTGGSNGTAATTCEAICGGSCLFGGVAPGGDYDTCVSTCRAETPQFEDNCGPEMQAYLSCLEANDCSPTAVNCLSQAQAWTECAGAL